MTESQNENIYIHIGMYVCIPCCLSQYSYSADSTDSYCVPDSMSYLLCVRHFSRSYAIN